MKVIGVIFFIIICFAVVLFFLLPVMPIVADFWGSRCP